MLRSFICLLLAILSLSHYVDCAENHTEIDDGPAFASFKDAWIARDWRIKGPNTVVRWQKKFNPHEQFFYLTYDPSNDYCEITQVSTESSEGETLTCKYKFKTGQTDRKIYNLIVPSKAEINDMIEFSWSSAESRAKNSWYISPMNFTKCKIDNLHKSEANAAGAAPAQTDEDDKDVQTMSGDVPQLPKITSANLTSEANGKKSTCELNQDRTEITCTQIDADGKKLMDGVKYELPTHWKAHWFRIHNLKSGVLLLWSDCVDGNCGDYSLFKLTQNGAEEDRYVHRNLNLECSDVESNLTVDPADVPEKNHVCFHFVCSEGHYKKNSEVKIESILQYRRQCVSGTILD